MQAYRSMVEYDRWANRIVFALCRDLDAIALGAEAKGAHGTLERTLKHLVRVEDAFLAMLRGEDPERALEPPSPYFKRDLAWFAGHADELADGYERLLAETYEAALDAELKIPWFERPVTRRDAFIQVMTHSIQHRAQVCSALGERGVEIPNLDYVQMRQEQ